VLRGWYPHNGKQGSITRNTEKEFTMQKNLALILIALSILFLCGIASWLAIPPVDPGKQYSSADLTATAACIFLTQEGNLWGYDVFGTPTPRADATATPTPPTGDAARGEQLFHGEANCVVCHSVADAEIIVGPSLHHIAARADVRVAGMDGATYLYNAIINPDGVIPSMGKAGIMPRTYAQTFEPQQINDMVAYLLTLK
jgi:mono/diheme cytochrome c family protein